MKKILFGTLILTFVLAGCGENDKHPFKAVSDYFQKTIQMAIDDPQKFEDEDFLKATNEQFESICKDLYGKTITAEIGEGLGFELVSGTAQIGAGKVHGDDFSCNVNFDLKVIDEEVAEANINNLMVVMYDDESSAVYANGFLNDKLPLKLEEMDSYLDTDSIEIVVDTIPADIQPAVEEEKANPYAKGNVITKGIRVSVESQEILLLGNASKLVVMKYDFDKLREIKQSIDDKTEKMMNDLKEKMLAKNSEKTETEGVQSNEIQETSKAEAGRGDLGIFELRGPVKTMNDGQAYTFNEKGQWLTLEGQKLSDMYYQVVRDKNGRLKELNADGYGSVGYNFNADGLATSIYGDGFDRELTYNKDGDVIKEVQTIAPEMGDEEGEEEKNTYTYEIVERDKYGNWIKRKANGKEIQTRTITYFE